MCKLLAKDARVGQAHLAQQLGLECYADPLLPASVQEGWLQLLFEQAHESRTVGRKRDALPLARSLLRLQPDCSPSAAIQAGLHPDYHAFDPSACPDSVKFSVEIKVRPCLSDCLQPLAQMARRFGSGEWGVCTKLL